MASDLIVYVGFAQPDEWQDWAGTYARHARRFEQAAGLPCITIPFGLASSERIRRLDPTAVVLSGFARSLQRYSHDDLAPVTGFVERAQDLPILAICGSHQLLGFIFRSNMDHPSTVCDQPMRRRRSGEPILDPDYHPEYIMERGFYELTLLEDDPLFEGCADPPIVCESHYCEIKDVPPKFHIVASTPECQVQAMRHDTRPLVGVQFHPEDYTGTFADGRRILENFFRQS